MCDYIQTWRDKLAVMDYKQIDGVINNMRHLTLELETSS